MTRRKFWVLLFVINFITIAIHPNPGSFVGLVVSLVGLIGGL